MPGAGRFRGRPLVVPCDHGHLGQNVDDLALPSWAEEPGLVLAELDKRIRTPGTITAEERRARLANEADLLADRARTALDADPEKLARFEDLLADARQIGHLTETHNYWIDRMAQASLRRFVVRVGRRLADAGAIEEPVGHLPPPSRRGPELLRGGGDRRRSWRIGERDLARFARSSRRARSGKPAEDGGGDRFDGVRLDVVRARRAPRHRRVRRDRPGPARVTLTQADFEAVGPGDQAVRRSGGQ